MAAPCGASACRKPFQLAQDCLLFVAFIAVFPSVVQGDNNYGDDRLLYARGQEWLHMNHIMGRAVG